MLSVSLYRKVGYETAMATNFDNFHQAYLDYNTTNDPDLDGVVVWTDFGIDNYVGSECSPSEMVYCARYYDPFIDWNLGATFNDDRYADRALAYHGWTDVPFVCVIPEPFCTRLGLDDTQWGYYFAAYVSGAHGLR